MLYLCYSSIVHIAGTPKNACFFFNGRFMKPQNRVWIKIETQNTTRGVISYTITGEHGFYTTNDTCLTTLLDIPRLSIKFPGCAM